MTRTKWEQIAETRWGRYLSEREKEAIENASRLAAAPGRAMDVGCEGGRWARLLLAYGWSVTCTDIDEEALALCASRLPDVECIAVSPDREDLPAADGSLGLVTCMEVLQVTMSSWFAPEMARVLAPGGLFVTVVWNRRSARGCVANLVERYEQGRRHPFYAHDYRSWRRNVVDHGFELVSETGMAWFPFGRSSDSYAVPAAAVLERRLGLARLSSWSPWVVVVARRRA